MTKERTPGMSITKEDAIKTLEMSAPDPLNDVLIVLLKHGLVTARILYNGETEYEATSRAHAVARLLDTHEVKRFIEGGRKS